jgi:hypothetical protein
MLVSFIRWDMDNFLYSIYPLDARWSKMDSIVIFQSTQFWWLKSSTHHNLSNQNVLVVKGLTIDQPIQFVVIKIDFGYLINDGLISIVHLATNFGALFGCYLGRFL